MKAARSDCDNIHLCIAPGLGVNPVIPPTNIVQVLTIQNNVIVIKLKMYLYSIKLKCTYKNKRHIVNCNALHAFLGGKNSK
jgi:hypothetical protein